MKAGIVIPARYGSTRFPGKPLVNILGKPLILHVWEKALEVSSADSVVVATDDVRIADVVESAGGVAVMTPSELPSGTDRVFHVAREMEWDVVVNLQGDEPLISPEMVDELIWSFSEHESQDVATVASRSASRDDFANPNVVKVVVDSEGFALYFSRSPIPYHRELEFEGFLRHVGIYAFRRDSIERLRTLPRGKLERVESLEQLRWMEAGFRVKVIFSDYEPVGVDVPEDVEKVEKIMIERGGTK